MKRKDIVDYWYFFPIQKNIQNEMEKRGTKKTKNSSLVGLGAVTATITKKSAATVIGFYDTCLAQVKPLKMSEDQFFYDFLKSPRKKRQELIKSFDEREKMVDTIGKQLKRKRDDVGTKNAPAKVDKIIQDYYEKTFSDSKWGSIGLLPPVWRKNFPPTLEQFLKTPEGQIIQHFCDQMKIK